MKKVKEEQGGALLTVFFILICFAILGLSIMSVTLQSSKVRTFTDNEIKGKMLAEIGLLYFRETLEKELAQAQKEGAFEKNTSHPVRQALENPRDDDKIIEIINKVAKKNDLLDSNKPEESIKKYVYIPLPQQEEGGFAIGYTAYAAIPYKDKFAEPSQPYSRKITVSIIGIPPGSAVMQKDGTVQPNGQKLENITATFYINTVPGPFHYAISTPGEVRFFGGSNIIGNVRANKVLTSQQYRYKKENNWYSGGDETNKTYIEGKVFLTDQDDAGVYDVTNYPKETDSPEKENIPPVDKAERKTTKNELKAKQIFMPQGDIPSHIVDLQAKQPFLPGWEPPVIEIVEDESLSLFHNETVGEYINRKLAERKEGAPEPDEVVDETSLSSEEEGDGLRKIDEKKLKERMFIESRQPKPNDPEIEAPSLTVRLTGKTLYDYNVSELFIVPQNPSEHKVTVEMGKKGQFSDEPTKDGEPFTYKGTIYIQGDLDIVNDIDMTGTIYVDGNVTIREATNQKKTNQGTQNLAIIASGKVILTNRYEGKPIATPDIDLSAFLYSDFSLPETDATDSNKAEKGMEIYSVESVNRIKGGIGTSGGYIELNTKREGEAEELASHLSIQFNRGIFEQETPGLPAGDTFFIDIYDTQYKQIAGNEHIDIMSKNGGSR
ncbi:hypothetical protein ABEV55_05460 [Aneurinibacillus thermoaerophilus]|uniref:hypothetical protein n=1 Tax=Aneurinibacillus thermoaerophilus TaxID=143495 RepID=UPI002E1B9555|nr:hypothetical protein [Aneurinibacillus thermoaerophilus]